MNDMVKKGAGAENCPRLVQNIEPQQEPDDIVSEEPIWKEGPFLFGILLFPGIFLLCLIIYLIHAFILE